MKLADSRLRVNCNCELQLQLKITDRCWSQSQMVCLTYAVWLTRALRNFPTTASLLLSNTHAQSFAHTSISLIISSVFRLQGLENVCGQVDVLLFGASTCTHTHPPCSVGACISVLLLYRNVSNLKHLVSQRK